jgi:carboxymethylenebutenolidase
MCFADGSLAPAAPNAGKAGEQQALTLTAADGNRLMAHLCSADDPATVGIVVLPDVRGLHAYYRDLTVRLAELGWDAVAIDYFGRTAPDEDRSDDFVYRPHIEQISPQDVALDVQAGVQLLRDQGVEHVFTLGFCFGGGYSWRQSADTLGLSGCIGFYGRAAMSQPVLDDMRAPLLLLHAGADAHIPVEDTRALADRVAVEADLVVFEGAPHSFFDRTAPEHADACLKAWTHITEFVERHS